MKLKEVTFTLNSHPSRTLTRKLLWCNTVPRAKHNKPAKVNGVQHHEVARDARSEISSSVEHTYYQPLN